MVDLWIASPHTRAKLRILERYLQAYLPIMCRHSGRLIYIDGFAGPGRYKLGEDGSPILVLKTILDHNRLPSGCQIDLHFIERSPDTYQLLLKHLSDLADARPIPDFVTYEPTCGRFADAAVKILERLRAEGKGELPRFVFIDPFGFGGTPMHVIAELAQAPSSEVLIFFPYASLHRFARVPAKGPTVDGLYGVPTWRQCLAPHDPDLQEQQLVAFYGKQLEKQAAFEHSWHFKLIDRRGRHFYLWFGTNSKKGLSQMKIAGWKVAPDTGQTYVAPLFNGQMELFQPGPPIEELERVLQQHFRGKGPVAIGQVEQYVLLETPFSEVLHLREPALMPMELAAPPLIEVSGRNRKAPGHYPPGTTIRFL